MIRERFVIPSESKYLKPLRAKLLQSLKRMRHPLKGRDAILVAVTEACTNSIRHAYSGENNRKIRVTVEDSKLRTVFRIRDYGRKIDLAKIKPPELPPTKPHGLGIHFIKTMMDEVKYNTAHRRGNELVLIKYKIE